MTDGNSNGAGVTMQQLADSLQVSRSTVSLALRGKTIIAAETRQKVQREAERLGYVYNRSAANLRQRRRTLVGLVVPDITNPFVGEVALGLQNALAKQKQFVVLANTGDEVSVQTEVLSSLIEERAGGIVLIPAVGTKAADLRLLHDLQTPAVLMNRHVPGSVIPFVGTDDERISRMAVEHLTEAHNITDAAYFGGLGAAGPRQARNEAFDYELRQRGISNAAVWNVCTGPNPASAFEVASSLLATQPPPAGILCHSDSVATGLLRAFDEAGASLEDCAIMSIDGIAASGMTRPPLTTIAVDPGSMGRRCGHLLLRASGYDLPPDEIALSQLIIRRSCGCRQSN